MNLKITLIIGWLLGVLFTSNVVYAQSGADREDMFDALSSGSSATITKQLEATKKMGGNDKLAFEGALLMRKAATVKVPAQKMQVFKKGHKLLQAAIQKDAGNAEFRFLRLMIQEHAPKALGYNKNIAEDAKLVKSNLNNLPTATKNAVLLYSKTSNAL